MLSRDICSYCHTILIKLAKVLFVGYKYCLYSSLKFLILTSYTLVYHNHATNKWLVLVSAKNGLSRILGKQVRKERTGMTNGKCLIKVSMPM